MFCDCEVCENFSFDEENDGACLIELDEDEYYNLSCNPRAVCPFFRNRDEYRIVRKQN